MLEGTHTRFPGVDDSAKRRPRSKRAILLNGFRNGEDGSDDVHQIVVEELRGKGWELAPFILRDLEIRHCVGCFGCWVQTPGECIVDDAARTVAREFAQSDLAVLLTPITFGGYSSELKKALDRSICLVSPFFMRIKGEIHHQPRYERYPCLIGIGVLPQEDEESEEIFRTLVRRNAINLHSPTHVGGAVLSGQGDRAVRERVARLLTGVAAVI